MRVTERTNYRVIVEPQGPRWTSYIEKEQKRDCEAIIEQIKRHVDGVSHLYVDFDTTHSCGHCGHVWTEKSDTYNGGCCEEDEKNNPEVRNEGG